MGGTAIRSPSSVRTAAARCQSRALTPGAQAIDVVAREDSGLLGRLELAHPGGLFAGPVVGGRPYRLRILLPNAVQEYRAAISIARDRGARSFGLQAALRLAKLYQSTGRPSVEAHDALAPALEGFAPTPEMPEIAEAQAMLAALSQTAEVKRKSRSGSD